jgi:hypothetical protein
VPAHSVESGMHTETLLLSSCNLFNARLRQRGRERKIWKKHSSARSLLRESVNRERSRLH